MRRLQWRRLVAEARIDAVAAADVRRAGGCSGGGVVGGCPGALTAALVDVAASEAQQHDAVKYLQRDEAVTDRGDRWTECHQGVTDRGDTVRLSVTKVWQTEGTLSDGVSPRCGRQRGHCQTECHQGVADRGDTVRLSVTKVWQTEGTLSDGVSPRCGRQRGHCQTECHQDVTDRAHCQTECHQGVADRAHC